LRNYKNPLRCTKRGGGESSGMFSGHNVAFFLNAAPLDSHWLTLPGIAFWVVTTDQVVTYGWPKAVLQQLEMTVSRSYAAPARAAPLDWNIHHITGQIKAPRPLGKPHLGPVFWAFASVVFHPMLPWLSILHKKYVLSLWRSLDSLPIYFPVLPVTFFHWLFSTTFSCLLLLNPIMHIRRLVQHWEIKLSFLDSVERPDPKDLSTFGQCTEFLP